MPIYRMPRAARLSPNSGESRAGWTGEPMTHNQAQIARAWRIKRLARGANVPDATPAERRAATKQKALAAAKYRAFQEQETA